MRVYVETNFVLELALRQEQNESCEALLRLAEASRIGLVVPAFSLLEPYATLPSFDHGEPARLSR